MFLFPSVLDLFSYFRPINLSDVIYKISSKTLANRLKPFMNSIMSELQSAFVPSRLITNNILVAFEVNHYLKGKTRGNLGHMAIKFVTPRISGLFAPRSEVLLADE